MRVLVCGGRDYNNVKKVESTLYKLSFRFDNFEICHGDCPTGADKLADDWAYKSGVDCTPYPADWDKYGNAAGPIRNARMLKEFKPNMLVAFPGGKGTANMVKLAKEAGVIVMEITDD